MAAPPELKTIMKATKRNMAGERLNLAREIIQARNEARGSAQETTARLEATEQALAEEKTGWEKVRSEFRDLSISVARRANDLATRITGTSEWPISKQQTTEEWKTTQREEIDGLKSLLQDDTALAQMREKISAMRATTEQNARDSFERQLKTVEQTIVRNGVFILHALNEPGNPARHNDNSIVGSGATLEDDVDLALALKPSLSCSSAIPGEVQGLWSNDMGLIIGGGDIPFAGGGDAGTVPSGIGERARRDQRSTATDIDNVVQKTDRASYNEVVVDNPEVFGMYQQVFASKDGGYKIPQEDVDTFANRMHMGWQKSIPRFVLTQDRRMFEFQNVMKDGTIVIGKEISPEDVARGRAGLNVKDREELGRDVIQRNLFRNIAHHRESKRRVDLLAGKDATGSYETTNEEYVDQLRKNPKDMKKLLESFPDRLLHDRAFLLEAARINPQAIVNRLTWGGGDEMPRALLKDVDFVKGLYAAFPNGTDNLRIIEYLPDSAVTTEIYLLALTRNDRMNTTRPTKEHLNDPEIRQILIERKIADLQKLVNPSMHVDGYRFDFSIDYQDDSGQTKQYDLLADSEFLQKFQAALGDTYEIVDGLIPLSKVIRPKTVEQQ